VRPIFRGLIPALLHRGVSVAILTQSKQRALLRHALKIALGDDCGEIVTIHELRTDSDRPYWE